MPGHARFRSLPALAVAPRTDCIIADEEAGRARAEYAEASRQRREAEKARIAAANAENATRLASIKSKTDDGDGLIGGGTMVLLPGKTNAVMVMRSKSPKRDGMGEMRDLLAAKNKEHIKQGNAEHQKRLQEIGPTIDDDTEDDATGEARARMKVESAARRKAEAEALRKQTAQFFSRVRTATPKTDCKIWDDGEGSAGAARSIVAAQSKARKAKEAEELAAHNAEVKKKLANVHSAVDDGDGHQF